MKILDLQLNELRQRLVKKGVGLEVTLLGKQKLLEDGYDALNGARPMRRLLQETLEDQIATGLLDETYSRGDIIRVSARGGKLTYATSNEPVATR